MILPSLSSPSLVLSDNASVQIIMIIVSASIVKYDKLS